MQNESNNIKVMWDKSIVGIVINYIMKLYSTSYLKKVVTIIGLVVGESNVGKSFNNVFTRDPIYKYSLTMKSQNLWYDFVIKYSGGLYNFVEQSLYKSATYNFVTNIYKDAKENKLKTSSCFVSLFFIFFGVAKAFSKGMSNSLIFIIIIGVVFFIIFLLADKVCDICKCSGIYKLAHYLFSLEV